MGEDKFLELSIGPGELQVVSVSPRGRSVTLRAGDLEFVAAKDKLTQLLRFYGLSRTSFNAEARQGRGTEVLRKALRSGREAVITVLRLPKANYMVRIATPEFTPIPHRVLFEFIDGVLNELGINPLETKVQRFLKRISKWYKLYEGEVHKVGDVAHAWLVVSNANTAHDAVHVYSVVEFVKCSNLALSTEYRSVPVVHRGDIKEILLKVKDAVASLLERLKGLPNLEGLLEVDLSPAAVENWLKALEKRTSPRISKWIAKRLAEETSRYGNNAYAALQAISFVAARSPKSYRELLLKAAGKVMEKRSFEVTT